MQTLLGRVAPFRLTDGREPAYRDWSGGYDPATWLDRAIHATREATFPLNGLDHHSWWASTAGSARPSDTRGYRVKNVRKVTPFPAVTLGSILT